MLLLMLSQSFRTKATYFDMEQRNSGTNTHTHLGGKKKKTSSVTRRETIFDDNFIVPRLGTMHVQA